VIRAGYEEAKILSRRQPIQKLVDDPRTPPERRAKLALVLQARTFADRTLGLAAGKSYTTFSQLDSDTLALVLSAAYRDEFRPRTWWFPIVGSVPYKGFFSESAARREIRRLEDAGFDTYLRPTSAFSTLGWFNDPVVSPVLRYGDVDLVNTVVHEIFHNTLYLSGQAQFNESVATFVGGRGAVDFFCRRDGPESPACREAQGAWEDDLLFGRFLDGFVGELEALYGRTDLTREAKLAARDTAFRGAQERFAREVQPRLKVQSFSGFLATPLNNATLISRRLYYHRLELFEQVYRSRGGDLPRTVADLVRAARGSRDAYAAVQGLLGPAAAPAAQ
jgi:predicted aminopeptidase